MYHLKIKREQLDLRKILNSGQVFRYDWIHEDSVLLYTRNHGVLVDIVDQGYDFHCSESTFSNVWFHYLDLGRDYETINARLLKKEPRLKVQIESQRGMRILRQDPFEMLFTFIVSQSKSIPQIRRLVNNICEEFGNEIYIQKLPLSDPDTNKLYGFPSPRQLAGLDEDAYRMRKYGYRAPYLYSAVRRVLSEPDYLNSINHLKAEEKIQRLMEIHGVGRKVASCVSLFAYGDFRVFPSDTWIIKTMYWMHPRALKKPTAANVEAYGMKKYTQDAGLAQQYIFEYGRQVIKNL